jgi:hypothetical protein
MDERRKHRENVPRTRAVHATPEVGSGVRGSAIPGIIADRASKAESRSSDSCSERRTCAAILQVTVLFVMSVVGFVPHSVAADEANCGSLANGFGPFDYRDPEASGQPLATVNAYHFSNDVENLSAGMTGSIAADLDYVLRAFPNHHRALYSAVRYAALKRTPPLPRSIECYFDRARRMAPSDAVVYVIEAIHFSKAKRSNDSIAAYRKAIALDETLLDAHYNLGLELAAVGKLSEANRHAQIAYRGKYPLQGLRNRLQRLGAWDPNATVSPGVSDSRE